jgi:hypothetical protein
MVGCCLHRCSLGHMTINQKFSYVEYELVIDPIVPSLLARADEAIE